MIAQSSTRHTHCFVHCSSRRSDLYIACSQTQRKTGCERVSNAAPRKLPAAAASTSKSAVPPVSEVSRRDLILATGGILAAGAVQPPRSLADQQLAAPRGRHRLISNSSMTFSASEVSFNYMHASLLFVHSADTGNEDLSKSLEARVQEFTLDNGLHFIVLPRHTAPIVSCHTYADVGAFDEIDGQTGTSSLYLACLLPMS